MNKYTYFICSFFVCSTFFLSAQINEVKVLKAGDQVEQKSDSTTISAKAQEKYNEGIGFFEQKKFDESIAAFSAAIQLAPAFGKAYLNRGYAYLETKNIPAAKSDFELATRNDNSLDQGFYELGILAETEKQPIEALAAYGKAIASNPSVKYYYRRAILYTNQEEYALAKQDLSAAIQLDQKDALILNDRGSVNKQLGDLDAAITDYKAAVEANPKMTMAWNNLGSTYRKKGDLAKSIEAYSAAISSDPTYFLAYNNRGVAKLDNNDVKGAIADFQKAIELNANYKFAHNNLAGAYLKSKQYENAITAASKAINLDQNYGFAYYNRGAAHEMLRDTRKACEDWSKAGELGVESAQAYFQNSDCSNQ